MPAQQACPDLARLQLLLSDSEPSDRDDLSSHLDTCLHCQQTLEGLAAGDRPLPRVTPDLTAVVEPAPALRQVMQRLEDLGSWPGERTETINGPQDPLAFLEPPCKPAHIGRLGRHDILEVIRRGGMGVVLKGFDEKLNRIVAIKVIAPQIATSAAARQRFAREARATAAIRDEHIVGIYAVEETREGLPYLVMEYVSGMSLQDRLDAGRPLPLEEILHIGHQTACGLAAAHAQGLIHRDIKPANILLQIEKPNEHPEPAARRDLRRATCKITDFGLARAVDDTSLTQDGVAAGTPLYMAPEQARGERIDHRADLFSLGTVLYTLCTGAPPFRADVSLAILKRVCEETPPPVRTCNPAIPEWLINIIDKLHAKDPANRFQSAAELAELLGRCLAHAQQPDTMPLPAIPSYRSTASRAADGRRGNRRRRRLVAACFAVLLGGLGFTEVTGITAFTRFIVTRTTSDDPAGGANSEKLALEKKLWSEAADCYFKGVELRSKDPGQAETLLRRALSLNQKLAANSADSSKYEQAVLQCRYALSTALNVQIHQIVFNPKSSSELVQRALALANENVESWPTDSGIWANLGRAYYRGGDWQAAKAALQKSFDLGNKRSPDQFFMAMTCWRLGEKERARRHYDEGITWQQPNLDDADVRRIRAEAATLLGVPEAYK